MSKKNKCIESTIGKIIYASLLFFPIVATAVNCLIAIFNSNTTTNITTTNVMISNFENVMNGTQFTWLENTAIYNTIHNTTTLLGITYKYLDMILTYWLLLTIIYVIYDIALIMVQMAHKKIHELIEQ